MYLQTRFSHAPHAHTTVTTTSQLFPPSSTTLTRNPRHQRHMLLSFLRRAWNFLASVGKTSILTSAPLDRSGRPRPSDTMRSLAIPILCSLRIPPCLTFSTNLILDVRHFRSLSRRLSRSPQLHHHARRGASYILPRTGARSPSFPAGLAGLYLASCITGS
jgi:hypothetical protein